MARIDRATILFRPLWLPAAAALLLGSCGSGLTGPRRLAQERLDEARARWEAVGSTSYDYDFTLSCFCAPEITRPARVQVRGGTVVAVFDKETNEPRTPLSSWYTIPSLFDRIQGWIDLPANTLEASYDDVTGLPTSVSVDPIRNAVDDEAAFTAGGLVVVQP